LPPCSLWRAARDRSYLCENIWCALTGTWANACCHSEASYLSFSDITSHDLRVDLENCRSFLSPLLQRAMGSCSRELGLKISRVIIYYLSHLTGFGHPTQKHDICLYWIFYHFFTVCCRLTIPYTCADSFLLQMRDVRPERQEGGDVSNFSEGYVL